MSMKPLLQNGEEVLRKGPWMPEEDEILVEYVRQLGARDWSSIRCKGLLPRTGKSCRLRWVNKLKPDLKRSGCKFSPEEERLVVEIQAKLGNKWAKIASCLPGRTDNDVKNFWSTRQKRILRALQRPKTMASGSTDASADTSDLSKDRSLSEFGAFQLHSPTMVDGGEFPPPFMVAEDGSAFRDQHGSDNHRLQQHSLQTFNSMDIDAILNIKPEHMIAGETQYEIADNQRRHSNYPQAVAPCITVTTRTARPRKRRPCLRRDSRNWVETTASRNEAEATGHQEPDLAGMSVIHNNDGQVADVFGVPLTDSSQQSNNNYLDFLLHSEGTSALQSTQVFSPELDTFLASSYQWEKLPTLYPQDSPGLLHDKNTTDSSSPESVITCFAADVFDSLEPLCPAPTEWWVARLSEHILDS